MKVDRYPMPTTSSAITRRGAWDARDPWRHHQRQLNFFVLLLKVRYVNLLPILKDLAFPIPNFVSF
jgi:hypothetical protein